MIIIDHIEIEGNLGSADVFIHVTADRKEEREEGLFALLSQMSDSKDSCIVTVPVSDWNKDLSPWKADPVFGNEAFGDGAKETLDTILLNVIPKLEEKRSLPFKNVYLCGYSLAGLFALWASFSSDVFTGIVAASPSVWFKNWIEYAKAHEPLVKRIYLSLGDKEAKTRNQLMSKVEECINEQYELLKSKGIDTVLVFNPGNHFKDASLRVAKGMAWMLEDQKE